MTGPTLSQAHREEERQISLGGRLLSYTLYRSRRRRSIGIVIDRRGLRVGAPPGARLGDIEALLVRHAAWVCAKFDLWTARAEEEKAPFVISDGARLPWLGGSLVLRLASGANRVCWGADSLTICRREPTDLRRLLVRAIGERARAHFQERLEFFAPQLDVAVPPLALSSARTRWGSCSLKSGVRLNRRLIHLPPAIIDYVVVHELAHLRQMNHGPQFWSLVASVCPEHRALRDQLRRLAADLPNL